MPIISDSWATHRARTAAINGALARSDPPSWLDVADRGGRLPVQRGLGTSRAARTVDAAAGSDTVSPMLVAFSVAPSGVGEQGLTDSSGSVSEAVAAAVRVVRESGLPNSTDAMFTTVEGDWEECLAVVKSACDAVGRYGSRVSLVLKADIRPGWDGQLTAKVDRVEHLLREAE